MNLEQAANALQNKLSKKPWYIDLTVSHLPVGSLNLYADVAMKKDFVHPGPVFHGFPVIVRFTIRPAK